MTAPRFALLDHGLTGPLGHNLTYARRVLAAARAQGFEPLAGVGRTGGGEPLGAPALPVFPRDVWANNPAEGRRWHALALLARTLHPAAMSPPAVDVSAGAATAGDPSATLSRIGRGLRSDAAALFASRSNVGRFAAEMDGFIAEAGLQTGDIVYMPTVIAAELQALDRLLDRSASARALRWRAMLRYAPQSRPVRAALAAAAGRLHRRADADVAFFSDTEPLCAAYEALCDAPFGLLPVPVELDGSPRARPGEPLTVGYLGDARDEKGFDLLPEVVRLSRKGRPLRFVLQVNLNTLEGDPGARAAVAELAAVDGPGVERVAGPLSADRYRALFARTDIVLLPYRPQAYAARSSGVLMEAIAAGLPSVVTPGGWMEATLKLSGDRPAGVAAAPEPAALAAALQQVAGDWARYAGGARALREVLRPRLDPAELVRRVAA